MTTTQALFKYNIDNNTRPTYSNTTTTTTQDLFKYNIDNNTRPIQIQQRQQHKTYSNTTTTTTQALFIFFCFSKYLLWQWHTSISRTSGSLRDWRPFVVDEKQIEDLFLHFICAHNRPLVFNICVKVKVNNKDQRRIIIPRSSKY
jgi:hypothetical protein